MKGETRGRVWGRSPGGDFGRREGSVEVPLAEGGALAEGPRVCYI